MAKRDPRVTRRLFLFGFCLLGMEDFSRFVVGTSLRVAFAFLRSCVRAEACTRVITSSLHACMQ